MYLASYWALQHAAAAAAAAQGAAATAAATAQGAAAAAQARVEEIKENTMKLIEAGYPDNRNYCLQATASATPLSESLLDDWMH